jgi:DNA-binding winged helix-turn-helix (wHTH) protein
MSLALDRNAPQSIRIGRFELDEIGNRLTAADGPVAISPLAARFLAFMARHEGDTVTREALIDALWRGNALVGDDALNRLVSEVRKSLGDTAREPTVLQTVPRVGYRLVTAGMVRPLLWPRRPVIGRDLIISRILLIVAILLGAAAANWLLETAIGLQWAANYRGG